MAAFDDETAVVPIDGDVGAYAAELTTEWDIGDTANGGYALSPVLRALTDVTGRPDPLSVTTHFLRPVQGGGPARIATEIVRQGRSVTVARGTLHHAGSERLVVTAVLGDLSDPAPPGVDQSLAPPAPPIPPPDECLGRSGAIQGVELPILGRLDIRLPPARMVPGGSDDAVSEGWIRLGDGAEPDVAALVLFADAFPPSLLSKIGRVGWVPTLELTVHVRRRPCAGWVRARFECDDLAGGRMVESGSLWDAEGRLVARSRQLGLLLPA